MECLSRTVLEVVAMRMSNVTLTLVAAGLAACTSGSLAPGGSDDRKPEEAVEVETARSPQERDDSPALADDEQRTFAASQAAFALDIYQAVRKQPEQVGKDIFLSPHSISIALAMTYAGARGETAAEMKRALHFDLPDERIHDAFNHLDLELARRGQGAQGKDGEPFRLKVANSMWGQQGTPFEQPFLDILAKSYGSGMNVVDFIADTESARQTINAWVEEKTEDRIKDILPPGILTNATRFVIVNAVYFNAAWAVKFPPWATGDEPFTKLDGSQVQVSMMRGEAFRPYATGDGWEAVEMPYEGNELSMVVIVPSAGTFASFESTLTGGEVLDILAGLQSTKVELHFPKLRVEGDFGLKNPLAALGMKKAFTPEADLSGITKAEPLRLTDVIHKTFVDIDEHGTEAAAATVTVGGASGGAYVPPVVMKVDRPFFMAIVDRQTKTLVFFGRVLEPKPG
jgi:serpin B